MRLPTLRLLAEASGWVHPGNTSKAPDFDSDSCSVGWIPSDPDVAWCALVATWGDWEIVTSWWKTLGRGVRRSNPGWSG